MDNLFLVRHGAYVNNQGYHLSEFGITQMHTLSTQINSIIGGGTTYICSSPENVALESAQVLADDLKIPTIEGSDELWSGSLGGPKTNKRGDAERVNQFLETMRGKADSIIAVSHLEVLQNFPNWLISQQGLTGKVPLPEKGQLFHFDYKSGAWQILIG